MVKSNQREGHQAHVIIAKLLAQRLDVREDPLCVDADRLQNLAPSMTLVGGLLAHSTNGRTT